MAHSIALILTKFSIEKFFDELSVWAYIALFFFFAMVFFILRMWLINRERVQAEEKLRIVKQANVYQKEQMDRMTGQLKVAKSEIVNMESRFAELLDQNITNLEGSLNKQANLAKTNFDLIRVPLENLEGLVGLMDKSKNKTEADKMYLANINQSVIGIRMLVNESLRELDK